MEGNRGKLTGSCATFVQKNNPLKNKNLIYESNKKKFICKNADAYVVYLVDLMSWRQ